MPEDTNPQIASLLEIDRSGENDLYTQIARSLRENIQSGRISRGTRLPSSRALAETLNVSRNTTINAYNQLRKQDYLESKVGSGTYVSDELPEKHTRPRPPEAVQTLELVDTETRDLSISPSAERISEESYSLLEDPSPTLPFRPGIPALEAFPHDTWAKLASRRWRHVPGRELVYGDPAGYPTLREAIAEYLRTARGVRCEAGHILITSGIQQSLTLTARVLLESGENVWVEDPGYPRMKGAFSAAGGEVHPVPIDEKGLNLSAGPLTQNGSHKSSSPRLVGITPSHQYPLGVTMGLSRRLELLQWATNTDTWILEDDYDSEYRFSSKPIAALQGLDNAGRVLYAGTFSKVLFPAIRIGYLVVPPDLVDAFVQMRSLSDRCPSRVNQMVLTDFINEGYFEEHIRRMRTLYASRQSALLNAIDEYLSDLIEIRDEDAGLHLVGHLPEAVDDQTVSSHLREHDIVAPPLSFYSERPDDHNALLLGYSAVSEEEIEKSIHRMADALTAFRE
jgi:GntR family transcriptional regulator/MocR family aminotransferase